MSPKELIDGMVEECVASITSNMQENARRTAAIVLGISADSWGRYIGVSERVRKNITERDDVKEAITTFHEKIAGNIISIINTKKTEEYVTKEIGRVLDVEIKDCVRKTVYELVQIHYKPEIEKYFKQHPSMNALFVAERLMT